MTYEKLLNNLQSRTPFVFIRYGDGEIKAIYGHQGQNCDAHTYFPDMGKQLDAVLREQDGSQTYHIGLQPLGDRMFPRFKKRYPNIQWCNADILHNASQAGQIDELIELLSTRKTMMVGPAHLQLLMEKMDKHVIVPDKDCWLSFETTYQQIVSQTEDTEVVVLSCSMMAEPLIHRIHQAHPDMTLIDAGSLWDPYCGVNSRKYHEKLEL